MIFHESENDFYLHSDPRRFGKFLAHAQLYEMSLNLPGDFVEVGVFKGASFFRFRKLARLFHPDYSRQFIGFDTFGEFPDADFKPDSDKRGTLKDHGGHESASEKDLMDLLEAQGLSENVSFVKGDVRTTLKEHYDASNARKIAIVNIELDLYEPIKEALAVLYPRVSSGGVIILDDYAYGFPGATKAVDEFLAENGLSEKIQKLPFAQTPCFLIKN